MSSRSIIVGITDGLPTLVHRHAAELAKSLGVELIFVTVDQRTVNAARVMDPMGVAVILNSEGSADSYVKESTELFTKQITDAIGTDIPWKFEFRDGLPAQALAKSATEHDALMIVVGTREPGIGGALREIVAGSVAAQLSHHQSVPVLVVPLRPQAWQTDSDADK